MNILGFIIGFTFGYLTINSMYTCGHQIKDLTALDILNNIICPLRLNT